jgi:hypothetical protein
MTENKKPEVVVTNAAEFRQFVISASQGQRAQYHRGDLATDRHQEMSDLPVETRAVLDELAEHAGNLARIGFVLLTQRREGEQFVYLAIRSAKSWGGEPQSAPVAPQVLESA